MSVLWYVHHQGAGHWRRALAAARHLSQEVVFASSAEPPGELGRGNRLLRLPLDAPASPQAGDVTASGAFHWVPEHHPGLAERHARLLAAVVDLRPALAVVDVSVEVTVLLRTAGVPVVAVRLPGERTDAAHRLGFGVADRVVMPVPERWGLHEGSERTTAVGLVSAGPDVVAGAPGRDVVVVVGRGGTSIDLATCARLAADCPDRTVRVLGVAGTEADALPRNLRLLGQVADPFPVLAAAGVVVANCGLGTVADVVLAGRPLVVLPEDRPFGEQAATAAALDGDAVVLSGGPGQRGWRAAVERAEQLGPPDLVADGAARFAALVAEAAERQGGPEVASVAS